MEVQSCSASQSMTVKGGAAKRSFAAALAVTAALALSGCAGLGSSFGQSARNTDTPFGNYLAGRYAGAERDLDAASSFLGKAMEQDPDNSVLIERAFIVAISAGDMDEAAALAEKSLETGGEERLARLVLALSALKSGDYEDADRHIREAAPGPFTALIGTLTRAWAAAGQGDGDAANAILDTFKGRPAFELFRAYHAALIAEYLDQPEAADTAYREAVSASAGASLRVVEAYGRFLERTGRTDEAASLYRDYEALSPEHPLMKANLARIAKGTKPEPLVTHPAEGAAEALYGLGSALAQESGLDLSIVYLQLGLYLRPDFDVARILLGDIYERAQDWKTAITTYEGVDSSSPLRPNADIQIAINYDRLEKTDEAEARLRDLQERMPGSIDPVVALGDIFRAQERYSEAAKEYTKAIGILGEVGPENWSVLYARGVCYERLKRWPEAEKDLKRALVLSDEHPLVLNYLGYSWVDQKLNLDTAMEMIRKAVDQRPQDGFIVDSLGWAHYRLGNYEEAVKHLERAVVLQPDDPVINDHLGDALWKVGRKIEARFQWRHALEMKPEEDLVPQIEAKIEYGLEGAGARQRGEADLPEPANGTEDKGA